MRWSGLLCQLGPLFGPCDGGISGVQALRHLFADDVDQALEGLLHIDVVLGAGLKELKTWRGEQGMRAGSEGFNEDVVPCAAVQFRDGAQSKSGETQF